MALRKILTQIMIALLGIRKIKCIESGASRVILFEVEVAPNSLDMRGLPQISMEVVMELHLHSHHFERRTPDWRAAAVSGIVAGAVLLFLAWILVVATGGNVWGPPRMVAAIALGNSVFVRPASFDPAMAQNAIRTSLRNMSRALPICALSADRIETQGALGNERYDEDHDHPDIGFDVTRGDSSHNLLIFAVIYGSAG
jgi:hypothetical protein